VKKERLANGEKFRPIKPQSDRLARVIHKVIQGAEGSADNSLFGLLLLIEKKIGELVRRDFRLRSGTQETFKLGQQRRPAISKLSRYVE
jgi:hypothetical protein